MREFLGGDGPPISIDVAQERQTYWRHGVSAVEAQTRGGDVFDVCGQQRMPALHGVERITDPTRIEGCVELGD